MKNLRYQFFLLFCAVLLFFFPDTSMEGARTGLLLWSGTIVPTLLPFLLLTNLMQKYNTLHLVSKIFYPVYYFFPDLNKNLACTFVTGYFCGCPLGAKIINDLVLSGSYTKKEGQSLLALCNHISPMFTVGYTLHLIFADHTFPGKFLFCLYAPGMLYLIILFLTSKKRGLFRDVPVKNTFFMQKSMDEVIFDSLRSIFSIGVYLMIFSIGACILKSFPYFPLFRNFLICILEITTGITSASGFQLPFSQKAALLCAISSFGGLCGAAQTAGVCKKSGLSIRRYLAEKSIFALISGMLGLILF